MMESAWVSLFIKNYVMTILWRWDITMVEHVIGEGVNGT
jgi:hypothetical protein